MLLECLRAGLSLLSASQTAQPSPLTQAPGADSPDPGSGPTQRHCQICPAHWDRLARTSYCHFPKPRQGVLPSAQLTPNTQTVLVQGFGCLCSLGSCFCRAAATLRPPSQCDAGYLLQEVADLYSGGAMCPPFTRRLSPRGGVLQPLTEKGLGAPPESPE